jgi:hypothetical protein
MEAPAVDEFGAPLTEAGPKGHATVGGATVGKGRLRIQDEQGRDLLAPTAEPPSMRAGIARDAKRFLEEGYSTEPSYRGYVSPEEVGAARPRVLYPNDKGAALGPTGKVTAERWRGAGEGPDAVPAGGLEGHLADSVRILGELKSAAAAGKLTAAMVRDATKAGMPSGAIAKAIGKDAVAAATSKAADAALARIAQTVRAGKIPSPAMVKQAIAAGAKQSTVDSLMRAVAGPAQAF